jgi:hypothetical protein
MRCAFSWITTPAMSVPGHAGGDIACAVETPAAVLVLIGDVMGHGATAAVTAEEVTHAFPEIAAHGDPAPMIAMRLDEFVIARDSGEEFVTAQIIWVPKGSCEEAEIVCCGHPPPLLLRDGKAVFLDSVPAAPPLGLLDLSAKNARAWPLGARPGDGVLLYTDGVTDARDSGGRPFPLAERAAALAPPARDPGAGDMAARAPGPDGLAARASAALDPAAPNLTARDPAARAPGAGDLAAPNLAAWAPEPESGLVARASAALDPAARALGPESGLAALIPRQDDQALRELRADLLRHTGGRLQDDATLLRIQFAKE